jgi:hypothetical protein
MKTFSQMTLAVLLVALTTLVPVSAAYATGRSGRPHTQSQTYHDRTPKAHTHGSHLHHS